MEPCRLCTLLVGSGVSDGSELSVMSLRVRVFRVVRVLKAEHYREGIIRTYVLPRMRFAHTLTQAFTLMDNVVARQKAILVITRLELLLL